MSSVTLRVPGRKRPSNVGSVFHRLWTKAVGTEDYAKAEWLILARVLVEQGLDRASDDE